jgi:hypothetical protein
LLSDGCEPLLLGAPLFTTFFCSAVCFNSLLVTAPFFGAPLLSPPHRLADPFIDYLEFVTKDDGRFAVVVNTAKPAAKIIRLSQLLRADLTVLTDLHRAPAAGACRAVFASDYVPHAGISRASKNWPSYGDQAGCSLYQTTGKSGLGRNNSHFARRYPRRLVPRFTALRILSKLMSLISGTSPS